MAAEQGDASAQYNVGIFYYYGHGVDRNPEEAIKWIGIPLVIPLQGEVIFTSVMTPSYAGIRKVTFVVRREK